ncbi:hypothetical protein MIR68_000087 [Amoeboaphelidium protococcarum]|nr:hypothetical protein MIR68_000087 [Amoeboaphelidium protococcarum]
MYQRIDKENRMNNSLSSQLAGGQQRTPSNSVQKTPQTATASSSAQLQQSHQNVIVLLVETVISPLRFRTLPTNSLNAVFLHTAQFVYKTAPVLKNYLTGEKHPYSAKSMQTILKLEKNQLIQLFQSEYQLVFDDLKLNLQDVPHALGMKRPGQTYTIKMISLISKAQNLSRADLSQSQSSSRIIVRVKRCQVANKGVKFDIKPDVLFSKLFKQYEQMAQLESNMVYLFDGEVVSERSTPTAIGMLPGHDYVIVAYDFVEYDAMKAREKQSLQKQPVEDDDDIYVVENGVLQSVQSSSKPQYSSSNNSNLKRNIVEIDSDLDDDDMIMYQPTPSNNAGQSISSSVQQSKSFARNLPQSDMQPFQKAASAFRTALDGLHLGSQVSRKTFQEHEFKQALTEMQHQYQKPAKKEYPGSDLQQNEFMTLQNGIEGQLVTDEVAHEKLQKLLDNFNIQYPPDQRMQTPTQMQVELKEYQKIGLTWMTHMEKSTFRGGLVCDTMGLGKTCLTISTIVANPPASKSSSNGGGDLYGGHREEMAHSIFANFSTQPPSARSGRATLVIVPLSLMEQWRLEFEKFLKPAFRLKVIQYHSDYLTAVQRKKFEQDPNALGEFDIVLATYQTVAMQFTFDKEKQRQYTMGTFMLNRGDRKLGCFFKYKWHRVVLDEAHVIKNRAARSSIALSYLMAEKRWCLTGTPIQNSSDDLYPLFRFLEVEPYCHWNRFKMDLSINPKTKEDRMRIAGREEDRMKKLQTILQCVMMRRTKDSKIDGSDRPIVELPEKTFIEYQPEFTQKERELYDAFAQRSLEKFKQFEAELQKHYHHIFGMITKMRQMCLHYSLVTKGKSLVDEMMNDELNMDHMVHNLNVAVANRLGAILDGYEVMEECAVCFSPIDTPVVTVCGHIYCVECILNCINSRQDEMPSNATCPICRHPIKKTELIPLKAVERVLRPEQYELENREMEQMQEQSKYITSTKITELMNLLDKLRKEHPGEKAIVFCDFTSMLSLIEPALRQAGIQFVRIDGSMKLSERAISINRLNEPNVMVMLASLKAGCVGLNLVAANHVIMLSLWWNPAIQNQAIDRVHRIGQMKEAVYVHTITIPNTIEDRIKALQEAKQQLANGALGEGDGGNARANRLSRNELLYLFRGGERPRN